MRIKEWHRTVILMILLVLAVALIIYLKTGYQTNLENILG
jgi:hypothetical protein